MDLLKLSRHIQENAELIRDLRSRANKLPDRIAAVLPGTSIPPNPRKGDVLLCVDDAGSLAWTKPRVAFKVDDRQPLPDDPPPPQDGVDPPKPPQGPHEREFTWPGPVKGGDYIGAIADLKQLHDAFWETWCACYGYDVPLYEEFDPIAGGEKTYKYDDDVPRAIEGHDLTPGIFWNDGRAPNIDTVSLRPVTMIWALDVMGDRFVDPKKGDNPTEVFEDAKDIDAGPIYGKVAGYWSLKSSFPKNDEKEKKSNPGWTQYKFPPGAGWQRRLERTIFKIDCPGKDGQIARFVVLGGSRLNRVTNTLVGWENEDTHITLNTTTNIDECITPEKDKFFANFIMKYSEGKWAAYDPDHPYWPKKDKDPNSEWVYPDEFVKYGLPCVGDMIGGWMYNDCVAAMQFMKITTTAARLYAYFPEDLPLYSFASYFNFVGSDERPENLIELRKKTQWDLVGGPGSSCSWDSHQKGKYRAGEATVGYLVNLGDGFFEVPPPRDIFVAAYGFAEDKLASSWGHHNPAWPAPDVDVSTVPVPMFQGTPQATNGFRITRWKTDYDGSYGEESLTDYYDADPGTTYPQDPFRELVIQRSDGAGGTAAAMGALQVIHPPICWNLGLGEREKKVTFCARLRPSSILDDKGKPIPVNTFETPAKDLPHWFQVCESVTATGREVWGGSMDAWKSDAPPPRRINPTDLATILYSDDEDDIKASQKAIAAKDDSLHLELQAVIDWSDAYKFKRSGGEDTSGGDEPPPPDEGGS